MEISKVVKYSCDICGKESEWIKGQWIAHINHQSLSHPPSLNDRWIDYLFFNPLKP